MSPKPITAMHWYKVETISVHCQCESEWGPFPSYAKAMECVIAMAPRGDLVQAVIKDCDATDEKRNEGRKVFREICDRIKKIKEEKDNENL